MRQLSEHTVAFAYVEFHDGSGGKKRPVIIISLDGEKVTFYRITSQYFNKSEYIRSKYYQIRDWVEAGLTKPSWVDTITPLTVSQDSCYFKILGHFTKRDIIGLERFINSLGE